MTSSDSKDARLAVEAWMDGLAGRSGETGTKAHGALQQGRLVRHLMQQRVKAVDDAPFAAEELQADLQWQRVRLRLGSSVAAGSSRQAVVAQGTALEESTVVRRGPAVNRWAFAIAASVAVMVAGGMVSLRTGMTGGDESEVVMRGLEPAVRVNLPPGGRAADVAAKASSILESNDIKYRMRRVSGGVQIQFKLRSNDSATAELSGLGLPVGGDGIYNLVIVDSSESR